MSSAKRMSIWSFVPPSDSDCDVGVGLMLDLQNFNAEIAKWISIVLEKEVSTNLIQELQSGEVGFRSR